MDKVIKEVKKNIGMPGLRKLAYALSGPHHNRIVADEFDLSLFQVAYLNNNISVLCHAVLENELEIKREKQNEKNNNHDPSFIYSDVS
jgi:hypothetical protein